VTVVAHPIVESELLTEVAMRRSTTAVWAAFLLGIPVASLTSTSSALGAAPASCEGRVATIVGTPGPDDITGTPGDDVITGLGGADRINGAGGNDRICGDAGADDVAGGPGDDRIWGGAGPDHIRGLADFDNLFGGAGNDVVSGGDGGDLVVGNGGHNTVLGGAGRDRLPYSLTFPNGQVGHNLVRAGAGADAIIYGPSDDIYGGDDDDDIRGVLEPGSGHVLDAGPGSNFVQMSITPGWTHLDISIADATVDADGSVTHFGGSVSRGLFVGCDGAASVTVTGTDGPDYINAFGTNPAVGALVLGLGGDDRLGGNCGDDTINGGAGTDLGFTSTGTDTCISIEGPYSFPETGCDVTIP
jgi:Ca2+-binding RTX toxin-like protein